MLHCVKKSNILLILLSPAGAETDCVRWEIEHLFSRNFSQKHSYQKLLKSDNLSSSYSRKCLGCFVFETQCSIRSSSNSSSN